MKLLKLFSPSCFFCKTTEPNLKKWQRGMYSSDIHFHEACAKKVLRQGPEQHADKKVDIAMDMIENMINKEKEKERAAEERRQRYTRLLKSI